MSHTKDRAQIARENGAKSRGPVTEAGKSTSSQNAARAAERARHLAHFLPPHHAVVCNESREAFQSHLAELTQIYRPANQLAAAIVREIATTQWQIERLNHCLTFQWNVAVVDNAAKPAALAPELLEIESMARAAHALYTSGAVAHRLNRQIDQLLLRIARLERRLKFVHANFPSVAESPQPEKTDKNEPVVYVTENTPEVLRAYRQQFPHCKIVVLPPDNVANGIDIEDDMPIAPRKAA